MLIGAALQAGCLPIGVGALETAIRLNGAAVEENLTALALGRALVAAPDRVDALFTPRAAPDVAATPFAERLAFLAAELDRWADTTAGRAGSAGDDFRRRIESIRDAEHAATGGEAVARVAMERLFRLTAIKDEWEVARLHADPAFAAEIAATFEGVTAVRTVLAPPFLARRDPATGRPAKVSYGPWIRPLLGLMAKARRLRGSLLDVFGRTAERREERRLRDLYRADIAEMAARLAAGGGEGDALAAFAAWPEGVRGYGPVKEAAMAAALERRAAARAALAAATLSRRAAE